MDTAFPRPAPTGAAGLVGLGGPGLMLFLKEQGITLPPLVVWGVGIFSAACLIFAAVQIARWLLAVVSSQEVRNKIKLQARRVEPSHIIILGLVIALGGVIWQMKRGPHQSPPLDVSKLSPNTTPPAPTYVPVVRTAAYDIPFKLVTFVIDRDGNF